MPRPPKLSPSAETKLLRLAFAAVAGPHNDTNDAALVELREAIASTDDETLKGLLGDDKNKPSLEDVVTFAKKLYELGKIGYEIAKKLGVIK